MTWGGFSLLNSQARPKPPTMAWLWLGLAWATAFVCNNQKKYTTVVWLNFKRYDTVRPKT